MDFASWKDRKAIAQALKVIYRAADTQAGLAALDAFAEGPWAESSGRLSTGAEVSPIVGFQFSLAGGFEVGR